MYYNGFVKGGVIQKEDFESYSVKESSGIEFDFDDMTLLTHGAPSGGPVMGLAMKVLEGKKGSTLCFTSEIWILCRIFIASEYIYINAKVKK